LPRLDELSFREKGVETILEKMDASISEIYQRFDKDISYLRTQMTQISRCFACVGERLGDIETCLKEFMESAQAHKDQGCGEAAQDVSVSSSFPNSEISFGSVPGSEPGSFRRERTISDYDVVGDYETADDDEKITTKGIGGTYEARESVESELADLRAADIGLYE
jgi:hypothetical protein